jgi:hypothetical protein
VVKLLAFLIMSGALADALAPAPPPLLIDSVPASATQPISLDAE